MDDIDILKSTLSPSDMSPTISLLNPHHFSPNLPLSFFSDFPSPTATSFFHSPTIPDPPPLLQNHHHHQHRHKRTGNSGMTAMREMIFQIAAMQPIQIDPEAIKAPKRRNVRISKDPQSIAARHRRERISQKIRILQRLVPGGTKMDTASMLDEAVHYVKFLKRQVQTLEQAGILHKYQNQNQNHNHNHNVGFMNCANLSYSSAIFKACQMPITPTMAASSLQMHS